MSRIVLMFILCVLPAQAQERAVLAFGGQMTLNGYSDFLGLTGRPVRFTNSRVLGVGGALQWRIAGPLKFGVEGQVVRHFGRQTHWEVNVPAVLRIQPRDPFLGVFDGVAGGLGLSLASDVPSVEVQRFGQSHEFLAYWMVELSVETPSPSVAGFARVHHRSDAFGLFGEDAGSNVLVVGLRHGF